MFTEMKKEKQLRSKLHSDALKLVSILLYKTPVMNN